MIALKEEFKDVLCGINAEKIDCIALTDIDHNIINETTVLVNVEGIETKYKKTFRVGEIEFDKNCSSSSRTDSLANPLWSCYQSTRLCNVYRGNRIKP